MTGPVVFQNLVEVYWDASNPTGRDSLTHKAQLDGDFRVADRTICGLGIPSGVHVGTNPPWCRRCVAVEKRLKQERRIPE